MDLLNAVEQIVGLAKGSHLEKEFFTKVAKPLKFVADKMEPIQNIILQEMESLNGENSVSLAALMAHCDNERLEQKEGRRIGF